PAPPTLTPARADERLGVRLQRAPDATALGFRADADPVEVPGAVRQGCLTHAHVAGESSVRLGGEQRIVDSEPPPPTLPAEPALRLGGEQRIVAVEPPLHAGVQDLERHADLLVRERAARHE